MSAIKIAIIGLGAMGMKHLSVYSSMPNTEVVAIADVNVMHAKTVSEQFGGIPYFGSYEEMFEKTKVDAAVIAVPDAAHVPPVTAALAAGAHVLVEKPLATSLADADAMIRDAKKREKILMVNFTHRWVPAYYRAKQVSQKGELGPIAMIYAKKMIRRMLLSAGPGSKILRLRLSFPATI